MYVTPKSAIAFAYATEGDSCRHECECSLETTCTIENTLTSIQNDMTVYI